MSDGQWSAADESEKAASGLAGSLVELIGSLASPIVKHRPLHFMTWIKICGITNLDDALPATEAGANALGFVFYPKSPRYVTVETALSIAGHVPSAMEKVGVFVNESVGSGETVKHVRFTAVQLHGDESTEFSRALFQGARQTGSAPNDFPHLAGENF